MYGSYYFCSKSVNHTSFGFHFDWRNHSKIGHSATAFFHVLLLGIHCDRGSGTLVLRFFAFHFALAFSVCFKCYSPWFKVQNTYDRAFLGFPASLSRSSWFRVWHHSFTCVFPRFKHFWPLMCIIQGSNCLFGREEAGWAVSDVTTFTKRSRRQQNAHGWFKNWRSE